MKTIYKYHFDMRDETTVEMPEGAEILCVQMQKGYPCLWAIVETENQKETHCFCIRGMWIEGFHERSKTPSGSAL